MMSTKKKLSILVVDDETVALKHLSHFLKKEGFSVVAADNGSDALDIIDVNKFDIVMTDLRMGKVNGIDVLKRIRSKYPETKVIIFTGYATVDVAVEAMRIGAFHFIEKPLRLDEVRSIIEEASINK